MVQYIGLWHKNKILWRDLNNPIYVSERIEVLAPVPSYEKWKNMDDLLLIYKEENKRLKAVKEHCENVAGQYADKLVDTNKTIQELKAENKKLKKQLDITLETLGQIAMYSNDKVDAIQAAKAICDIKEVK